jgi:hypothetical protein
MAILFRPGDGKTIRVHFNTPDKPEGDSRDDDDTEDPVIQVVMGEVGEFGPLASCVVAGHASVVSG